MPTAIISNIRSNVKRKKCKSVGEAIPQGNSLEMKMSSNNIILIGVYQTNFQMREFGFTSSLYQYNKHYYELFRVKR